MPPQQSGPIMPSHMPSQPGKPPKLPRDKAKLTFVLSWALGFATIVFAVLAVWAFMAKNTAEDTVNQQIEEAVAAARQAQAAEDAAAEKARAESVTRSYTAPPVFGTLTVAFPKPWNIYVEENEGSKQQLNGFIHPDVVQARKNQDINYAFRFVLERELYTKSLDGFERDIDQGKVRANAVTVSGISGTRLTGEIERDRSGTLILLPVRDKTLRLWTYGTDFLSHYNTIVDQIKITP